MKRKQFKTFTETITITGGRATRALSAPVTPPPRTLASCIPGENWDVVIRRASKRIAARELRGDPERAKELAEHFRAVGYHVRRRGGVVTIWPQTKQPGEIA